MSSEHWLSAHAYLPHSMQSEWLRSVVAPLVTDAPAEDTFFFLRYWQGGPHVRLRLAVGPHGWAQEVTREVAATMPPLSSEQLQEYDYEIGLQTDLAAREGEVVEESAEPGSVLKRQYLPEYGKYGGSGGIQIAERVFCRTSLLVLRMLTPASPGESGMRLPIGESLELMAHGLAGSGLDIPAAISFLRSYEDWWSSYLPSASSRDSWPRIYDSIAARVGVLCKNAWQESTNHETAQIFMDAASEARTLCADQDSSVSDLVMPNGVTYLSCVANYLHTTNNRLGIIPSGEAFVAHVLRLALEKL